MNRYFLYLVFLNMLINVIIFVPKILIEHRYNGSVMGVLIAIPIGIGMNYLYSHSLNKFPGQGLPEILADSKHRWLVNLHLGSIQILWFSAGLITLLGFIDILSRFVNPEMPKLFLITIYLAAIFLIIQLPTKRVMYFLEIVLFLNTPLIGFIIYKTLTSEFLSWDSILEVGTHLFEKPSLKAMAAATYTFSGFTNLIIFNRVIKEKLKIWNFIIILFLGVFNLFTTFFIPIGFHGSDGAQEYLYPWISTSDSLRLVYSPIERVLYIFLMFYMSISLMSISIHWHVAFELLKGTFKEKENNKKNWMIMAAFMCCAIAGVLFLNTVLLNKITAYWMILLLGVEVMTVSIFFIWARRRTA
ncbi:GerAB/ArcD/ProY family transporter [Paenibacillus sp. BSR1-1]|uniref:GerAB/ArcD/ProY family transporter n=1 Tax=Paenibacillus sp. BSR1-1 TaxID=3020845 RepID=UPI0025B11196|nr:GerAB/ArcD/ProY family transporter [Paenibacillus sp. BSR1-1]MDN3015227.1 GerAB/ArcD/ProY family transporter [Paenibacillus sp. BSR1-1]